MATYSLKICKLCSLEKQLDDFSKRKVSKDGFRNICKSCCLMQNKKRYLDNKEKVDRKSLEWRLKNSDKLKINVENFHKNNPDYRKEYYVKNKNNIYLRNKKRRESDNVFKIKENIRCLILNSFKEINKKKNTKTLNILGCTYEEFKLHLELQFESWMNWSNKGNPKDGIYKPNKTWDIDHIIPLSTAKTEEEIIKLNHYSNFQPLCSYYNRFIKKDKIN